MTEILVRIAAWMMLATVGVPSIVALPWVFISIIHMEWEQWKVSGDPFHRNWALIMVWVLFIVMVTYGAGASYLWELWHGR